MFFNAERENILLSNKYKKLMKYKDAHEYRQTSFSTSCQNHAFSQFSRFVFNWFVLLKLYLKTKDLFLSLKRDISCK